MATASPALTFTDAAVQRHHDCIVVTAHGDIDATNADQFAVYALSHIDTGLALTVDLRELKFFGTAGFSALHTINDRCAAADIRCDILASGAVARVIKICDPQGVLPVSG
jgi:anti-anti-sigma factor